MNSSVISLRKLEIERMRLSIELSDPVLRRVVMARVAIDLKHLFETFISTIYIHGIQIFYNS